MRVVQKELEQTKDSFRTKVESVSGYQPAVRLFEVKYLGMVFKTPVTVAAQASYSTC